MAPARPRPAETGPFPMLPSWLERENGDWSECGERFLEVLCLAHRENDQTIGIKMFSCDAKEVLFREPYDSLTELLQKVRRQAVIFQLHQPAHHLPGISKREHEGVQEGILSLMQMPRSTVAIQMLQDAGLPYLVVLTDPTSGGVMAAYAMLGDVQIAEPGATLAFTGRRVIETTVREKLPDHFQTSEYYREHGLVDMIVSRKELRATLAQLIDMLGTGRKAA